MADIKNEIISTLYKSKDIDYVMSHIPPKYREDLKQYAFEELLKMDNKKFVRITTKGNLLNYFKRMIWIQWHYERPKNKGFMKEWKEFELDEDFSKIPDTTQEETNEERILNLLDDKNYISEILNRFININKNSVNYFFNRSVFELYYFERMTLVQISKETDIGYESIRKSVNFTLQFVKSEIQKEI